MDKIPHSIDAEGIRAYAKDLASRERARMKKKHGANWGEKPKPWHERVGSPWKHHDGEPVWYDPKKYPPGSVIQSEAPDLLAASSTAPGRTRFQQAKDAKGRPVWIEEKYRVEVTDIVDSIPTPDGTDMTAVYKTRKEWRKRRIPKMVWVCVHSGEPASRCCPWLGKYGAASRAAAKADQRVPLAQRRRSRISGVRTGGTVNGEVTKCNGIDPLDRTIVGTPGQLRAEARRYGKYIGAGPGAE